MEATWDELQCQNAAAEAEEAAVAAVAAAAEAVSAAVAAVAEEAAAAAMKLVALQAARRDAAQSYATMEGQHRYDSAVEEVAVGGNRWFQGTIGGGIVRMVVASTANENGMPTNICSVRSQSREMYPYSTILRHFRREGAFEDI